MELIRKLFRIPSGETVTVEAVELHEVRWTSRKGEYSGDIKPEAEVFTSKQDADAFATALKNAFTLLKHTGKGTSIEVKKREEA